MKLSRVQRTNRAIAEAAGAAHNANRVQTELHRYYLPRHAAGHTRVPSKRLITLLHTYMSSREFEQHLLDTLVENSAPGQYTRHKRLYMQALATYDEVISALRRRVGMMLTNA